MQSKIIAVLGRYISIYQTDSNHFVADYSPYHNTDTYRLITAHVLTEKDDIYIEHSTGEYKIKISIERGKKRNNVFTCYVDEAYDYDEGTLERITENGVEENEN